MDAGWSQVADVADLTQAQEAVEAAEKRLWLLCEELLGWTRPSWAPSASLTSDWFSEEDSVYDDVPETAASAGQRADPPKNRQGASFGLPLAIPKWAWTLHSKPGILCSWMETGGRATKRSTSSAQSLDGSGDGPRGQNGELSQAVADSGMRCSCPWRGGRELWFPE
jgi:hypothetical protein